MATTRQSAPVTARRMNAQRGFTLIELMVALAVFMVGLAGVVSLQVAAGKGLQRSGDLSMATALATSRLEELQAEAFDTLAGGSAGYDVRGLEVASSPYFTVAWTVSGSDLKQVTVTTRWHRTGEESVVELRDSMVRP